MQVNATDGTNKTYGSKSNNSRLKGTVIGAGTGAVLNGACLASDLIYLKKQRQKNELAYAFEQTKGKIVGDSSSCVSKQMENMASMKKFLINASEKIRTAAPAHIFAGILGGAVVGFVLGAINDYINLKVKAETEKDGAISNYINFKIKTEAGKEANVYTEM